MNNTENNSHYFSGISGLQLQVPRHEYPEPYHGASRLTYYASLFNSIEINSSFYKLPMSATVKKWAGAVPDNFRFTFKLWKQITHNKNLVYAEEDVQKFVEVINGVNNKKGCILIQFPPGLHAINVNELIRLLNSVTGCQQDFHWPLAVEFRNRSWYTVEVYEILQRYDAALVLQDIPASSTPMDTMKGDTVYLRFHGPAGNYRDSYPEYFLSEYALYIKEWIKGNKKVFAYFNNTMGDAFNNLQTLNKLVLNTI